MIEDFYKRHVTSIDRIILLLAIMMFVLGVIGELVNKAVSHYPGNNYLPLAWLALLPFMLIFLVIAWRVQAISPRLAFFTRFYTLYYLITVAMSMMTNGIQFTPFTCIDHLLLAIDQVLGVNTADLLSWTAHHPIFKLLFELGYSGITIELFFLPAVVAWFEDHAPLNDFLLAICFSYLVGALIYYFLPTAAPSSVVKSPYFLQVEHITALKFFQIHHHIQPSSTDGGLIAFPSFHVFYAILLFYIVRSKYWLYLPVGIINLVGMIATVMLGWHYLVDVVGGIVLAIISILFTQSIRRHYSKLKPKSNDSHKHDAQAKVECG